MPCSHIFIALPTLASGLTLRAAETPAPALTPIAF
jgi:hypothetical protein